MVAILLALILICIVFGADVVIWIFIALFALYILVKCCEIYEWICDSCHKLFCRFFNYDED